MLTLLIVEDDTRLQRGLKVGLEATGAIRVVREIASGEAAVAHCLETAPEAVLMDVALAGEMNGIQAAVAIRRENPRLPVVFYSIQYPESGSLPRRPGRVAASSSGCQCSARIEYRLKKPTCRI